MSIEELKNKMELREYQKSIIQNIYSAWNSGAQNVLLQLATGGGKTVIFCEIIKNFKEKSIAIAHRIELVSQISLTLARNQIRHNIIAPKHTIRTIIAIHMSELQCSYYDVDSKCCIAGIDTLIRLPENTPWFSEIKLVIQDEGHHPLKKNKWGIIAARFKNARGLYPTATPLRADGHGLGRHAEGIMDVLIEGIDMRSLINQKYLTEYRIIAPPNNLDLSSVPVSTTTGDYNALKLRTAVHKSHIVGNVVTHYKRFAEGKQGITFAVDIAAAIEIAQEFKNNNISAEVVTSKTPDLLRANIMRQFRNKEILQLVNVDLLGEGVDVPAIEVVSMARPTCSYAVYSQQFGRALRPILGKTHAIIIDHVNNCLRHGLPDAPRGWSLDRREKRSTSSATDIIPLRTCPDCFAVYSRLKRVCPYCDYYAEPTNRSSPEFVDGDLYELDAETLAKMRGEILRIDSSPIVSSHLSYIVQRGIINKHEARQETQFFLREKIALWAGFYKNKKYEDFEILKKFFFDFGIDIMTAQTLGIAKAKELQNKIENTIDNFRNTD